jgi:hypothetical protein
MHVHCSVRLWAFPFDRVRVAFLLLVHANVYPLCLGLYLVPPHDPHVPSILGWSLS